MEKKERRNKEIAAQPLDITSSQWLFSKAQSIVFARFDLIFTPISEKIHSRGWENRYAKTIYDKRTLTHNLISNQLEKPNTVSVATGPE